MSVTIENWYDHHNDVRQELGIKDAYWSVGYPDLNEVYEPLRGVKKLTYSYDWFDGCGDIEIELPTNATGAQILKAIDMLIQQSRDFHHVFIEHFKIEGDTAACSFGS